MWFSCWVDEEAYAHSVSKTLLNLQLHPSLTQATLALGISAAATVLRYVEFGYIITPHTMDVGNLRI